MKAAKSWREGTKSSNRVCASVDLFREHHLQPKEGKFGVCVGGGVKWVMK